MWKASDNLMFHGFWWSPCLWNIVFGFILYLCIIAFLWSHMDIGYSRDMDFFSEVQWYTELYSSAGLVGLAHMKNDHQILGQEKNSSRSIVKEHFFVCFVPFLCCMECKPGNSIIWACCNPTLSNWWPTGYMCGCWGAPHEQQWGCSTGAHGSH